MNILAVSGFTLILRLTSEFRVLLSAAHDSQRRSTLFLYRPVTALMNTVHMRTWWSMYGLQLWQVSFKTQTASAEVHYNDKVYLHPINL